MTIKQPLELRLAPCCVSRCNELALSADDDQALPLGVSVSSRRSRTSQSSVPTGSNG